MKNIIKEKGITLIALVITIIVLLILAGVAISMLSGENGILSRANEAKENTETAQKEEEEKLEDMELQTYLLSKSNYKYANGYITGIEPGDIIANLKSALPEGYEITNKYVYDNDSETLTEQDIEDSDVKLTTGMVIKKDGKEVAKTVIFGDARCQGKITILDYQELSKYSKNESQLLEKDFIKVAMDVNHDGRLDFKDIMLIKGKVQRKIEILQQEYAKKANEIIEDKESILAVIGISNKKEGIYILDYDNKKNEFYFVSNGQITVETLINALLENSKIKRDGEELATTEIIQDGDEVVNVYNEKEYVIGKIKIN